MENVLERFTERILLFLTQYSKDVKGHYVKKHNENFTTHGDFSFPNSVKSSEKEDITLLEAIEKDSSDLIEESKNWDICLDKVIEVKGRVYLFLQRPRTIRVGLGEALCNIAFVSQQIQRETSRVVIDPLCEGKCDLTSLRAKYLSDVIKNLCAICGVEESVFVTWKSSSKLEGNHTVFCGSVLNAKTGVKDSDISAEDYIRLRQDEMTLIAQHKYGIRVTTDSKWKEFISHLGESAAVFELLQVKPSGPVKINFECLSAGSSKGASFVLYNCARLESIIKKYYDNVKDGTYPELPGFGDVDFALLNQEDEWCLIFNYILTLPSLLKSCVDVSEQHCEFRTHNICNYLCSMVRVVSQYYRRVRILVEPRKHLLPVIFARIHMLKILNETLKTCLKILNIKSVSQM